MIILDTPRLQLRALTPEIYETVFTTMDPAGQMQFLGCKTEAALAEERKKWKEGLSMYRKTFIVFQMIEKLSGEVMGWCGYHTWYLPHRRAEIGYLLSDDVHKGKGYMSEALPEVLRYGFEEMDLWRIEAFVGPTNIPSLKLIERFGFRKEGHLQQHYFVNGFFDDSLVFGLLRSEYEHARASEKD